MALRKKQAPSPKKTQIRSKAQKKMIFSKDGQVVEKRLIELVDSDIEEHKKLPAFEIDMFLANLVKELDPTIQMPEIIKEPVIGKVVEKSNAEEAGKGKTSIGEIHEMIEDIVKTATIFEKSRKSRQIKMAKSGKKDAPSAR